MAVQNWFGVAQMDERKWTCGHCGRETGNIFGYYRNDKAIAPLGLHQMAEASKRIVICPICEKPTYFEGRTQMPGVAYGAAISHLPADVGSLYTEARNCMSVSAFTASVLATRKLLMNVAVSQGADENKNFQTYVSFLADKGYVPPNAKTWVDHIRDKANEATHEIPAVKEEDAKDLLTFMEMILKLVFEYPQRVPKPLPDKSSASQQP